MAGKGGNKGRKSAQSGESAVQNKKDEQVHRDPDIGGVFRRESRDQHMRGRTTEFTFNPFKKKR